MYYEIFESLCAENGVSAFQVSKETGVSQSSLSDWKNKNATPQNRTLKKIADYFGVSVAYLKGLEASPEELAEAYGPAFDELGGNIVRYRAFKEAEAEDAVQDRVQRQNEELKFALWDGEKGMTDSQFAEVKKFAAFLRERDKDK